jgi:hypothetical protein
MPRFAKVLVAAGFVFSLCVASQSWAQTLPKKTDEKDQLHFYVIAEMRGFDLLCCKVTSVEQIKQKVGELDKEAFETGRKNAQLNKEIADLKKKLPGLKALKGLKKTDAEKEQVQKDIDDTEASINLKNGEMRPPVTYRVSRSFSKSEEADALIAEYQREAQAARERAEKAKPKEKKS